MAADEGDIRPDPGGVQAAVDRYRDIAKYLITIFAGVGALLIAGTQLASVGDLSFEDEPDRVIAVVAGLILAVAAIAAVVGLALRVLRPVEMTFDEVIADAELCAQIDARTSLLGGARSLDEVRANLDTTALTEEDRESWFAIADEIVAHAAYLRARARPSKAPGGRCSAPGSSAWSASPRSPGAPTRPRAARRGRSSSRRLSRSRSR